MARNTNANWWDKTESYKVIQLIKTMKTSTMKQNKAVTQYTNIIKQTLFGRYKVHTKSES